MGRPSRYSATCWNSFKIQFDFQIAELRVDKTTKKSNNSKSLQ